MGYSVMLSSGGTHLSASMVCQPWRDLDAYRPHISLLLYSNYTVLYVGELHHVTGGELAQW